MINHYDKYSGLFLKQLPKGVFMTVQARDRLNTMTIAWAHIGILWGKPVMIAYVRYSRFTYDLLLEADDFTINVPLSDALTEALKIAGSESGRDVDKFNKTALEPLKSVHVHSPGIKQCDLNYECQIIYRQTLEPALIPEAVKQRYYKNHDTHIVFYGEIVNITMKGDSHESNH